MIENKHYQLVARALTWIAANQVEQPDLKMLSAELGISTYHLQRVFQAWAGVSPKQFLKALTRQAALERLAAGESALETALATGLSGPGRLHDLMVSTEAMTPGEIRRKGLGVDLAYGFGDTPFGEALVCWNRRGIHFLGFRGESSHAHLLDGARSGLANAEMHEDTGKAREWIERIFEGADRNVPVWLRGSPFQLKVWEALLAIPEGAHATYGHIARLIGSPRAAQAVGNAVGSNPVSWIIPCHRVIQRLGETGGYRWGQTVKRAMIGMEATHVNPGTH
jgi:AraC family transcriptional regulator of adaptative response/methylated-DNA-[protein]-cysteine methyltransferase